MKASVATRVLNLKLGDVNNSHKVIENICRLTELKVRSELNKQFGYLAEHKVHAEFDDSNQEILLRVEKHIGLKSLFVGVFDFFGSWGYAFRGNTNKELTVIVEKINSLSKR